MRWGSSDKNVMRQDLAVSPRSFKKPPKMKTQLKTHLQNSKKEKPSLLEQKTTTKTRTEFPETWLWQTVKIKYFKNLFALRGH